MNDPHVERLHYRIETGETVAFENPPDVSWETPNCTITLSGGEAVVAMKTHLATEQAARAVVDPLMRGYELHAAILGGGLPEVTLKFVRADIVDRNPPPAGHYVLQAGTGGVLITGGTVTMLVTRRSYPQPPTRFSASPDVEILWRRYQAHRRGAESLTAMAYFSLTVVEASVGPGGARRRAAAQYNVQFDVLDRLGYLTSEVGDEETARKWGRQAARPHTGSEKAWMNAVVLKLIRRLGEYAADPSAPMESITMKDLPGL